MAATRPALPSALTSLQTRLTAGIGVATTVLVLIVGWAWIRHEESVLQAALERRAETLVQITARGLAGPLWNFDVVEIDRLLEALMADPEVQTIDLGAEGIDDTMRHRTRPGAGPAALVREAVILHRATTGSTPLRLGQVRLGFSRAPMLGLLEGTRVFVGALLAAVLAAVVASSYWLVRRWVRQPVSRLGQLAQRVAEGELGVTATVERTDEIGTLTHQFNTVSRQLQLSSDGLRRSESRYRSLFENAVEGIFQADAHGRLVDVNKAFATMLGYGQPADLLVGPSRLHRVVGARRSDAMRIARQLREQGVLRQLPLQLRRRDGSALWAELSAHLVPDEFSQGWRVEGMLSDISQRRAAEQELERHRHRLEELVAARTVELEQARRRAEQANESKSQYLATISHEFRTPLNAIIGFSHLLQLDASQSPEARRRLTLIHEAGQHLLALIGEQLDIASIEAGKVRLEPQPMALPALVQSVGETVRVRAEEKGLTLRLDCDAAVPERVEADERRLRQVLLNLLSNAAKFTDRGGVALRVSQLRRDAGQAVLRFEVSDTGIGMGEAQLARLFRRYEQVGESARRAGGSGLGLAISQELVRLMGGRIEVRSAPGSGSCFWFDLALPLAA